MRKSAILFMLLVTSVMSYAAKTDTLTMINGDRITCEIKKLDKGRLTVKTSDLGTLSVKWLKVGTIESKQILEITLIDHTRLYGKFIKSDSVGYATVQFGAFTETFAISEIVRIEQIGRTFWQGLDGYFDYGISFTSGTKNLQSTFGGEITYNQRKFKHKIKVNSIIAETTTDFNQRQDVHYYLYSYVRKRAFVNSQAGWEQNTELGIDSRGIFTVGFGYMPVDNNVNFLKLSIGPTYNRELTTDGQTKNNGEAAIAVDYYLYMLYKPKISVQLTSVTYTSFSVGERLRSNIDTRLSWEIFTDFTISGVYSYQYDSQPSDTNASTENYNYSVSLGYKF